MVMFQKLLEGRGPSIDYELLSSATEGYSGADVTQVIVLPSVCSSYILQRHASDDARMDPGFRV